MDVLKDVMDEPDSGSEDDLEVNGNSYCLPDLVLLHIFQYLLPRELLNAGETCKCWRQISRDELLWKRLFYLNFKIDSSIGIMPGKFSWMDEYKRLCYHTPLVQTEDLEDHDNQVLHVSFAHNGTMFATCSKDGFILVWDSDYPARVKHYYDMKNFSWKYTQFSQFNDSDTLLLVSGVHFGTPHSTSGEIAVFSLQGGFALQCRITNKPYDIFGTWYSDQYLLSGDLTWLAHLVSTSILTLNKASQESESEHTPIMNQLYRFYNCNASSIRAVMVARCLAPAPLAESPPSDRPSKSVDPAQHGNPPSHRDMPTYAAALPLPDPVELPLLPSVYARLEAHSHNSLSGAFQQWRRVGSSLEYACPITYNAEYRRAEGQAGADDDNEDDSHSRGDEREVDSSSESSGPEGKEGGDEAALEVLLENQDKLLIFTTGAETYTPHQIAFKRIKPVHFPTRLDPGLTLQERLAELEYRNTRDQEGMLEGPPEPNWLNYEEVQDRFDKPDHLIDLHGHIIGMGLSPDQRYLYVNSRPWPHNYIIRNPLDPPPIAQEIDIHVIDLITLKQVGTMLRAHRAYTPNNECFFIFLDVCNEYVASGAEDKCGYLWDRHYGICLTRFPHTDVVNSVAFNPRDPEMLVTTSDDYTVKVWRSRGKVRQLGLERSDLPRGVEVRKGSKRSAGTRQIPH